MKSLTGILLAPFMCNYLKVITEITNDATITMPVSTYPVENRIFRWSPGFLPHGTYIHPT